MKLYRIGDELYFAKNKEHLERWVCKIGGHSIITNCCTREVLQMIQQGDADDYQLVVNGHFSNHGEPDDENINEIEALNYICPVENKSF